MTFQQLGLSAEILTAITEIGYENPMPIQEAVIPHLLGITPTTTESEEDSTNAEEATVFSASALDSSEEATVPVASAAGRPAGDLIALAQTGTGKTAAYGLPVLQRLNAEDRTTQAIILSPTRELCLQICDDLKDYSRYIEGLHIVAVYGGASIEGQIRALKKGAQIIVATPGRLIDLMNRGVARLDAVRDVVLDEADEMLNMGFSESIDEILAGVPEERNILLFSATMGPDIERIAKSYLRNYKEIVVGSRNEGAENVNHIYYLVKAQDKYPALKRLVDYFPRIYAIIFCRTRIETQEIADQLIKDGYNAEALHGDLSQAQRDLTMQKFRQHRTQLLVATDVAARGLDVDDLTHVINYGLPDDIENYIHRSGRTGRAGKRGTSISIIHVREKQKVRLLEKTIFAGENAGKHFESGTLPEPNEICTKQLYHVIDQLEHVEVDEDQIAAFLPEVYHKLEWLSREDLIKRLVTAEFGRFVKYYADAPEIVQPKDTPSKQGEKERSSLSNRRGRGERPRGEDGSVLAEEGYKRLFLNLGKRDNFFAREIINLVNRYVKGKVEIGRIDLLPSISFFEVPEEQAEYVIQQMAKAKAGESRVVVDWADKTSTDVPHGKPRREKKEAHEWEERRGKREEAGAKRDARGRRESPYREDDEAPRRGQRNKGGRAFTRRDKEQEDKFYARLAPKQKEPRKKKEKKYSKDDWKQFFKS